jgi:hypothetical protein
MNTTQQLNKVRAILGLEVKLEQMELDNGAVLEAEVFEAGQEIFVIADDEKVAVPVGEYKTQDGQMIVVSEEGVIGEVKKADEEPKEEEAAEEPKEEEELSEETETPATPKKVVESISKEMFFSEIEKLRNEINELKLSKVEETEEVKEEVKDVELSEDVKLSEEAEAIVHTPEVKLEETEPALKRKSIGSTQNRIFNRINK